MGKLRFEGLGLMDDYEYQQPESDDALEFWMWCEEQSALYVHSEDDDESIEIEILPEDFPF